MRAWILLVSASTAFAAFAACATSDETGPEHASPPEDAAVPTVPEAAPSDAASDVEIDAAVPICSEAGWCTTSLPDRDLMMKDIWPLPGRAFAIAESTTLGVKVLEWRDQDAAWKYIDDNTQNQLDGNYAGAIWAPNDDTVYYAAASYIYRGTRLLPPATGWSWSRQRLEDNSHVGDPAHAAHDHGRPRNPGTVEDYPALGVWGIDANDVYAWYSNTVYHWKSEDGGAPSWVAEYVADDPDEESEHLFFVSAAGSGADDVWFAGVRNQTWNNGAHFGNCPFLVRKTPGGFARVADGVPPAGLGSCAERGGLPRVGGDVGWLKDIQSTAPGAITGLKAASEIVQISAEGVTVSVNPVPKLGAVNNPGTELRSFWRSSSDAWLTAWGVVIRGRETGDGGTYAISPLSLDGAPTRTVMHRVRGTSDTNLWAIGNGYAFHKTTP